MRTQCAALVASLLFSMPAAAAGVTVPTEREKIVVVSGTLQSGYHKAFQTVIKSARPDVIAFRNPTGRLDEAMLTATEIRKHGLNTFVFAGQPCSSTCALMFLAGEKRYSVRGAEIGFRSGQAIEAANSLKEALPMGRILVALGVPAEIVSKAYAVGPTRTYWLTDKDKELLRIVTLDETTVARHSATAVAHSRPAASTEVDRKPVKWRRPTKTACEHVSGHSPSAEPIIGSSPGLDFLPVPNDLPEISREPARVSSIDTSASKTLLDPTDIHSAELVATPGLEYGGETSLWLHPAFGNVSAVLRP